MNLLDNASSKKQLKAYQDMLSSYEALFKKYQEKLLDLKSTEQDQLTDVQMALDLTYLKEELDQMKADQDAFMKELSLIKCFIEQKESKEDSCISQLPEEFDKKLSELEDAIIDPIRKNYTANKNAVNDKLAELMKKSEKWNKRIFITLIVSILFNTWFFFGTIFMLYMAGIIVF